MLESLLLLRYLWIVYAHGETCQVDEHGPPAKPNRIGWLGHGRVIEGRHAGVAILVGLKPAVITCSKTAMYCMQEHFSGYHYKDHPSAVRFILFYTIPNCPCLVPPANLSSGGVRTLKRDE